MPIQFDKFDQQKVDRLKAHLEVQDQRGTPKFYEVYVDNLKAVQKTDDPSEFEGYENFLTDSTRQIKIVIYNSGASPRNDQFVFNMQAQTTQQALEMGLDGLPTLFSKNELVELKANRELKLAENNRIKELNEQVSELQSELSQVNEYVSILETGIAEAKANANKLGGVDIGVVIAEGLNGFIRKNTHLISKINGLNGVAKLIEADTHLQNLPPAVPENAEVSFTKKTEKNTQANAQPVVQAPPVLDEQEQHFLGLMNLMSETLTEEQVYQIISIMDVLKDEPQKIAEVMQTLHINE